jgi:hypothetical protein
MATLLPLESVPQRSQRQTPMEKYFMVSSETPCSDEVLGNDEIKSERVRGANYTLDLEIARLKRPL